MNVETIYSFVLPEVLSCPQPLARQAIVAAANEFCVDSMAWNATEAERLEAGISEYEPSKPSQSYIITYRGVYADTRKLTAVSRIMGEEVGEPSVYSSPDFGVLKVYPTPTESGVLSVDCVYGPVHTATTLPDFMTRYISVIAAGAKSNLLMMSGAAWANPQLATFYAQVFRDGVIAARIKEAHGRNPGALTVNPLFFG
jgi:hypothetical protein